jgi:hypothetical protein
VAALGPNRGIQATAYAALRQIGLVRGGAYSAKSYKSPAGTGRLTAPNNS